MNVWALVALVIIVGGIALSAWRRIYFTIVASVTCVVVFALQQVTYPDDYVAFMPHDLTDPERLYTVLTSMYAHHPEHLDHLLFNVLGLALIGLLFEQRIGTRPFILLYLLSGLVGTLAFAAYHWNGPPYAVLGASGAISGVLGGFARLYPNERLSFIFLPGYPMRAVYVIFIFVAIQLVYVTGADFNIAWQSHLAGLAAGILLAPLVIRIKTDRPVKARVSMLALRKLAVTPELQGILRRIEAEEVPDVRKAWVGHFMSKAKCPTCGAPIKITGDSVRCNKGHIL
jgi:membrane associated rhomboid family serine protease